MRQGDEENVVESNCEGRELRTKYVTDCYQYVHNAIIVENCELFECQSNSSESLNKITFFFESDLSLVHYLRPK